MRTPQKRWNWKWSETAARHSHHPGSAGAAHRSRAGRRICPRHLRMSAFSASWSAKTFRCIALPASARAPLSPRLTRVARRRIEIAAIGSAMRFGDVARWSISKLGFAGSERMVAFLRKLLEENALRRHADTARRYRNGPSIGEAGFFPRPRGRDARPFGLPAPTRVYSVLSKSMAGCTSMGRSRSKSPSRLARAMGATHVIAAYIPNQDETFEPAQHVPGGQPLLPDPDVRKRRSMAQGFRYRPDPRCRRDSMGRIRECHGA